MANVQEQLNGTVKQKSSMNNTIRQCPRSYIGLLVYSVDGLFRAVDFDDASDIQELVGQKCTIENTEIIEHDESFYLDPDEIICFITPDVEAEFIRRYEAQTEEQLIAWLQGEETDSVHSTDNLELKMGQCHIGC